MIYVIVKARHLCVLLDLQCMYVYLLAVSTPKVHNWHLASSAIFGDETASRGKSGFYLGNKLWGRITFLSNAQRVHVHVYSK